jgi:hypothetical protein
MLQHERTAINRSTFDWLSKVDFSDMYAVTLTMKQNNNGTPLDRIMASQNLRHFLNVTNQKIFGNAFRRYGSKLQVLPFIELSAWHRLHYHLSIEKPDYIQEHKFSEILENSWLKTNFSRKEIDIKKIHSSGWLLYCLKSKDSTQAIDFENLHFN